MTRLIRTTALTAVALALPAFAVAQDTAQQAQGGGTQLCEMGFSKVDADNDGRIDRAEVDASARADFGTMDANADGTLTEAEFTACKNAAVGETSAESDRSAENMGTIDRDGDGKLTAEEFAAAGADAYTRASQDPGDQQARAEAGRMIFAPVGIVREPVQIGPGMYAMRNRILFAALDADASGDVTEDEWAQNPAVRRDVRQMLIERFKEADVDQSGDLSEDEYLQSRRGEYDRAMERAQEARAGGTGMHMGAMGGETRMEQGVEDDTLPAAPETSAEGAEVDTTGGDMDAESIAEDTNAKISGSEDEASAGASTGMQAGEESVEAAADGESPADVPVTYYRYENVM